MFFLRHLWIFVLTIHIIFLTHAIQTKRNQWIWIILLLPGVGPLFYFFVEVIPEIQSGDFIYETSNAIRSFINPIGKEQELEEKLKQADSLLNRYNLAQEYIKNGKHDKAILIYKEGLKGVYEDDPETHLRLAEAYYLKEDYETAQKIIEKVKKKNPKFKPQPMQLFHIMIQEKLCEPDSVILLYEELIKPFKGEEAKCRYALYLEKIGQEEKAKEVFGLIIEKYRKSTKLYRTSEREWFRIAKSKLGIWF